MVGVWTAGQTAAFLAGVRGHRLYALFHLVALHGLRHGAATLALAAGTDLKIVQDQLGHSTITLTADTYTSGARDGPRRRGCHCRRAVSRRAPASSQGAPRIAAAGPPDRSGR